MAKIDVLQPTQFTRIAPNAEYDIIFKLNYLVSGSSGGTITVKLSDDPDFSESTVFTPVTLSTKGISESDWSGTINGNTVTATNVEKEIKYTMTFPNENKIKYMKIVCTEGSTVYETNPILMTSLFDLDFTLKNPIKLSYMPTRIKVSDKKNITNSNNVTIKVEACNNALDTTPTWEDVTDSYTNNGFYSFLNTTKTNADWAINVRFTIAKTSATATVELNEIYIGFA